MLNFNDIAIFTKVVEAGSFTGGAQLLSMPKATVSRKIAELENRLGTRLLERTTRKLRLTEAGREFYRRSTDSILSLDEACKQIAETQSEPQGTLRLTSPTVGQTMVCRLISEFMRRYPKVDIEIVFSDELLDLIDEGFDLAIRGGYLENSSLVARKLGPTQPMICASPDYLERHGTPSSPQELADHDCLILNTSAKATAWDFHSPSGALAVEVSGRLKSNDANFILGATLAGLGIARMPSFLIADAIRDGRLRPLLGDFNPSYGDIYLIYPSRRHLSAKVRCFIDYIEQQVRPVPPWLVNFDAS